MTQEVEPDLWLRDQDTGDGWRQLHSTAEAEAAILSRTSRHPWASIMRIEEDQHGEACRWSVMEVLGDQSGLYVAGDCRTLTDSWFWASWPEGYEKQPVTTVTVGPPWYQGRVWAWQVVPPSDAITQLRPALSAQLRVERQARGFIWRDRKYECHGLEHLRSPFTA